MNQVTFCLYHPQTHYQLTQFHYYLAIEKYPQTRQLYTYVSINMLLISLHMQLSH